MKTWHKLAVSGASALALASALAAHFEGNRLHAYRDVGGVWTICHGSTHDVHAGQVATPDECRARLTADMRVAIDGVQRCIRRPMTSAQTAAFGDLAYNIGITHFCRSSVTRRFNAGDTRGACAALLWYDKADGQVLRGLQRRRQEEYKLCVMP